MPVYKLDLDRLAKILGMMGSDHDGEVLNAARTAAQWVRASGMTWQEVLKPVVQQPPRQQGYSNPFTWNPAPEDDHRIAAEMILAWHATDGFFLYEREPDFLTTVCNWHRDLTERQQAWFDKIVMRARARGYPI